MKTGMIYRTTSPSGKVYIGQTTKQLSERKSKHFNAAFNINHTGYNGKFYNAIRKYKDDLIWETLYNDVPIVNLNSLEIDNKRI